MKKVAVIMGSTSDLAVASKTADTLRELEIPCEVHVLSAHRTPDAVADLAAGARAAGIGVIIAEAGLAAHLAGAVAARTTLPVIGVPLAAGTLAGVDALLATVQMPPGVPVACVGISAGVNAALLAAQILAVTDDGLAGRLEARRRNAAARVMQQDSETGGPER